MNHLCISLGFQLRPLDVLFSRDQLTPALPHFTPLSANARRKVFAHPPQYRQLHIAPRRFLRIVLGAVVETTQRRDVAWSIPDHSLRASAFRVLPFLCVPCVLCGFRCRLTIFTPDEFVHFEFVGTEVDEQAMLNTGRFQISQNLGFMFRRETPGSLCR